MSYNCQRSDERIKRLMAQVGMPQSISLMLAMKQLEQEVRLEVEGESTNLLEEANALGLKQAEQCEAEMERLQNWVNDLQKGKTINCVYCGHQYGPSKDTPVAMADVLKAHIAICPKHPLSAARKALSNLVEAKRLKESGGKTPEYEKARQEAWKQAEAVLKDLGG
jgi:hypothetical protein